MTQYYKCSYLLVFAVQS